MKIAYLIHWDLSRESGVLKKVLDQIEVWIREGNEVKLFALSPGPQIWEDLNRLSMEVVSRGTLLTRFFKAHEMVRRIMAWKPHLTYLRFSTYYPSLELLMTAIPTFLEMNTDDLAEARTRYSRFRYLYHLLTRERILRKAQGFICVSQEIADRLSLYRKPTVVIANGINLSRYPSLPAPKNPNPRLVFLGSPGHAWHGIDQIFWLAGHFTSWHFDLIGVEASDPDLRGKSLPNLLAHGPLNRARYEKILAQSDIAIGTLALYRKKMDEASPLKVREYLAYGIPTIIGYQDTDFPQPVPYLLRLPNTPEGVREHAPAIEQFVNTWKGQRVLRQEIIHLDVNFKEREKLLFFRKVLGRSL
jgi:glycosyltransferase involved in cell wall biosynthesis